MFARLAAFARDGLLAGFAFAAANGDLLRFAVGGVAFHGAVGGALGLAWHHHLHWFSFGGSCELGVVGCGVGGAGGGAGGFGVGGVGGGGFHGDHAGGGADDLLCGHGVDVVGVDP